jgi:hypothetical protein
MSKIILDLCGGTGAWSAPYKEAGYKVYNITLPEYDILNPQKMGLFTNIIQDNLCGVLAAPPCTMFSLARTTAKKPRDLSQGMNVVIACMDIIWKLGKSNQLAFWAMENPKGLLRKFMGKPAFEFDASEFGCDYNKHTDLWGYFKMPIITNRYTRFDSTDKNTRKLPAIPEDYIRDTRMTTTAIKRSITPRGFAEAFYKANK